MVGQKRNAHLWGGEHFFHPLLSRGDVHWENQIRRKRNRQNLYVIWSLEPERLEVKGKSWRKFISVSITYKRV